MTPATSSVLDKNLSFVQGDSWEGIPSLTFDPAPLAAVENARIWFRDTWTSTQVRAKLDSSDPSQINIVDANSWEFVVPVQFLSLKAGTYVWQFETTDISGVVQTYMQGQIQVYPDIARP